MRFFSAMVNQRQLHKPWKKSGILLSVFFFFLVSFAYHSFILYIFRNVCMCSKGERKRKKTESYAAAQQLCNIFVVLNWCLWYRNPAFITWFKMKKNDLRAANFPKKKKKTFPLSFYFVNAAETKEIDLVFLAPTKSTLGNQPKIIQEYPYKNKEKSHKVNDFKPR